MPATVPKNYADSAALLAERDDARNLYNLGNALARQGKFDEAIDVYNAVIEMEPDNEDAIYNRDLVEDAKQEQEDQQQGPGDDQQSTENSGGQGEQSDQQSDEQQEGAEGEPTASDQEDGDASDRGDEEMSEEDLQALQEELQKAAEEAEQGEQARQLSEAELAELRQQQEQEQAMETMAAADSRRSGRLAAAEIPPSISAFGQGSGRQQRVAGQRGTTVVVSRRLTFVLVAAVLWSSAAFAEVYRARGSGKRRS